MESFEKLIKKLDQLKKEILETPNKWVGYNNWIKENPKLYGLKDSSIQATIKFLKEVYPQYLNKQPEQIDDRLNKYLLKAEKFVEAANLYLAGLQSNSFSNRQWRFYFLSINQRKHSPPMLGQAHLITENGKEARLINVDDGKSKDYKGTFEKMDGRDVLFFNFRASSDDIKGMPSRELHVKIAFDSPNDEINLGTYTTFDRHRIYSGSLVIQQVPKNRLVTTALCSYRNNPAVFKAVPSSIRQYLSLRNRNYQKVPSSIFDLPELEKYLGEYVPLSGKANRFLELTEPRIYFATPEGSIKNIKNGDHQIVNEITSVLYKKYDKKYEGAYDFISKRTPSNNRDKDLKSLHSLKLLKRTRYFILLLTETKKASYSLIQLGWAMAHAKNILIIYNHNVVSSRIASLDKSLIHHYRYKSLQQEKDAILTYIDNFIVDNSDSSNYHK